MRVDFRTVEARVGGRFAFSWTIVLTSLPFFVLGLVATEVSPAQWLTEGPRVALVGLAGHAVIAAGFAVGKFLLFPYHRERPVALWKLVLWFLFIAQVRVAVLVWGLSVAGIGDEIPLLFRVVTSSLLLPLVFTFIAYSLESLERYHESRKKLIEAIVSAESQLDKQEDAVKSLRDAFMGSIDQRVSAVNEETAESLEVLARRIEEGHDSKPELQALLTHVDSRWRAISHSTWQGASIDIPATSGKEFLESLASSRPLSYLTVVFGAMFIFSLGLGRTLPLLTAVIVTLVWLLLILAAVWLVNEFSSRAKAFAPMVFIGGIVGLGLVGLGFNGIPGAGPDQVAGAYGLHISVIATSLFVGFGPALAKNQHIVTEALSRHLDQATIRQLRVESELFVVARKVASRLHSQTRGAFLAHVLTLQQALDDGDHQRALGEIRRIQEALLNPSDASEGAVNRSEIQTFLANWRSLVNINSNLHTTKIPETIRETVYAIVMDAVADAVRHGGADWVEISLQPSGKHSLLTVVNNGTFQEIAGPGLGSARLDQWAPGAWSRQVDVMGFVRLRVKLSH